MALLPENHIHSKTETRFVKKIVPKFQFVADEITGLNNLHTTTLLFGGLISFFATPSYVLYQKLTGRSIRNMSATYFAKKKKKFLITCNQKILSLEEKLATLRIPNQISERDKKRLKHISNKKKVIITIAGKEYLVREGDRNWEIYLKKTRQLETDPFRSAPLLQKVAMLIVYFLDSVISTYFIVRLWITDGNGRKMLQQRKNDRKNILKYIKEVDDGVKHEKIGWSIKKLYQRLVFYANASNINKRNQEIAKNIVNMILEDDLKSILCVFGLLHLYGVKKNLFEIIENHQMNIEIKKIKDFKVEKQEY